MLKRLMLLLIATIAMRAEAASDDALVTLAEGKVTGTVGGQAVLAFSRLKEGQIVSLGKDARLRIVYFANGRQEIWGGPGKLEIGGTGGKATGLRDMGVVQLPDVLVRQMAKTPVEGGQGRAGMTRLRGIVSPSAIAAVEDTYRQLRSSSAADDLNPEMYALSSWLELRAFPRVEQMIGELRAHRPADAQASQLADLYERTLREQTLRENSEAAPR
ncbi:MAG TPA: hypothetical protein VFW68_01035 [Rhodocyclaceae bacterium]|nr:hypothetical protein [Rhodocyclaceae bacterium]